jgi:hypothetical protein
MNIKVLNKQKNNEYFLKQNIKNYILNKYYDIIEDIINYCYKTNKSKKNFFKSYIIKLMKINKINDKQSHSFFDNNYEQNIDKKIKKKDNMIKNIYNQAILNIDNKSHLEYFKTRDVNHVLYTKYKILNFGQIIKTVNIVNHSFNKKNFLHKFSTNHSFKHGNKQIKSQFSNQITTNTQYSKTTPNLLINNKYLNIYKKFVYSNLSINENLRNFEKKMSFKLNKENYKDSIIKKLINIPNQNNLHKYNFNIDNKETDNNKNILFPEYKIDENDSFLNKTVDFSSSNKYITQLQTEKIKANVLTNLGKDIMEILYYYIKDNNEYLAIKYIKDYLEFINLNYKNKEGMTLLIMAIKYCSSQNLIQFLLDKGADPNICDVRIIYNIYFFIIFSKMEILHYILLFLIKILK